MDVVHNGVFHGILVTGSCPASSCLDLCTSTPNCPVVAFGDLEVHGCLVVRVQTTL